MFVDYSNSARDACCQRTRCMLSGNMADETCELISDDASEVELIPLEGCTSKIWKYFGFPGKDGQYLERDKRKRNEVTCCV